MYRINKFLLLIPISLLLSFTFVNEKFTIIDNAELVVTVDTKEGLDFFVQAKYDAVKGDLIFKTQEKIEKLTIFKNNKKLVYVLPISTKNVLIGKNLFESGDYELVFKLSDKEKRYKTELTVR